MDALTLNAICLKCIVLAVLAGVICLINGNKIAVAILVFAIAVFLPVCMYLSRRFIKKTESSGGEIEQLSRLLDIVKNITKILLSSESGDLGKTLIEAMEQMARCINSDRMYIWKNKTINRKCQYEKQYEWVNDEVRDKYTRPGAGYFYMDTIPLWDELLSAGNNINGPVSSLSKNEQEILVPFHIVSILVIPLFMQQKFWGFVSFDDCRNERTFSENEVSILRSGCLLLANAIIRNQDMVMIEERMKQQKLIASISKSFISKEPVQYLIIKALGELGEFLKTSRIVIATENKVSGKTTLEYSWHGSEAWAPIAVDSEFNETIKAAFPSTIPETGYITAICCNDTEHDFNGKFRFFEDVGAKSFILAPVFVDGGFWGYLSVEDCMSNRIWTESDVQLVGTICSSIAVSISRKLIEEARAEALQKALQASLAKGNFLANMSHEMRTPMNAIIGMTYIGKNSADIVKKDYAFEKIQNASNHLLGVINDILDMSKIEANKFELSPVTFNFEKMFEKAVSVISFRIDERRQEFTVQIDENIPPFLVGDDQRMIQVITNLLSNAVKFTPEHGRIALNARFIEKADELYTIQIEIKDSGIGITKEQQARLFTSFEQADSGTARKFGGTGLGLAISKRIVELMGGHIWIESEPEKGSTFAFTVKVEKGHGAHTGMLSSGINIRNIRILAIDDNLDILEYFGDVMARLNINCDIASSAREALEKMNSKGGYDMYFVDWRMPQMDGIELTKKIKKYGINNGSSVEKSVVIMISAYEWGLIEKDAKTAGVDKFLAKPLFPSAIVNIINECLGSTNIKDSMDEQKPETIENFENHTILLAEDVEINQEIVITLLEPTGVKIETVENGKQALDKFAENPEKYSMIFMDVQMPEMDGYEATRKIRKIKNERAQKIPIVAMTANVFREDVERCLAAGMNDHVGKPINMKDVYEKLMKYLH